MNPELPTMADYEMWCDAAVQQVANNSHGGFTTAYSCTLLGFDEELAIIGVHELPTEWVGGKDDGAEYLDAESLDLSGVIQMFDKPPKVSFVLRDPDDEIPSPHVLMEGHIDGKIAMIAVLSYPPENAKPYHCTDGGAFWEKDNEEDPNHA